MREYDQIKQQTIPEDLLNTINKFNEAKKVILFDEVLPKVSLDLLNLPSPKAIDALQQFQAAYSTVRTPSPWLKKKIIELMPFPLQHRHLCPVSTMRRYARASHGGIGRQDVLDANLEKQLRLLTDDAAWPMPSTCGPGSSSLVGPRPGLQAWLLEGISNGAKRESKPLPKKKEEVEGGGPVVVDLLAEPVSLAVRSRSRSRVGMTASGPSTTTRGSRSARGRSCGSARTTARSASGSSTGIPWPRSAP